MFFTILLATIVAIEGGMGSGKTTLSNRLIKYSTDFSYFPESITYLCDDERNELWNSSGTIRAIELLFLSEERRYNDIIKQNCSENSIIFIDRSYLTFEAFEYSKNNQTNLKHFCNFAELHKNRIPIPNYIIFLTVNPDIRIQRIEHRGDTNLPDYSMIQGHFNATLLEYFKLQKRIKTFFIDTSLKTPEEVFEESLKFIK